MDRPLLGLNNLNELTNVTRSGTLTAAGTTTSTATNVTVKTSSQTNNVTPYTDNSFAAAGFNLVDGNNTLTAIASDALARQDTNAVTVNLPATVNFQYDAKGNLTSDGKRGLDYDDENQLTRITVTNSWKTEFTYDGLFRRRIRKEYVWSGSWLTASETRYVYDGRVVLQERDGNNLPSVTYTRGLDLSGSLQGAGGIGGLLARTDHQSTINYQPSTSYYHADGSGSVTALLNGQQNFVARYVYDAFGNIISKSGPLADANTYRFSSQENHQPSGLSLYLYRPYDPNLQRFVNQDPIGERGGINLYGFVGNDPVNLIELEGLAPQLEGVIFDPSTGKVSGIYGPDYASVRPAYRAPDYDPLEDLRTAARGILNAPYYARRALLPDELNDALDKLAEKLDPPLPDGVRIGYPPPIGLKPCKFGVKKVIKFKDSISTCQLRGLSLTSGSKKLRALGLKEDRLPTGRRVYKDSNGHLRATWDGDHWDKYAPGGQGIRLDDAGHIVDPRSGAAHIPSTGKSTAP